VQEVLNLLHERDTSDGKGLPSDKIGRRKGMVGANEIDPVNRFKLSMTDGIGKSQIPKGWLDSFGSPPEAVTGTSPEAPSRSEAITGSSTEATSREDLPKTKRRREKVGGLDKTKRPKGKIGEEAFGITDGDRLTLSMIGFLEGKDESRIASDSFLVRDKSQISDNWLDSFGPKPSEAPSRSEAVTGPSIEATSRLEPKSTRQRDAGEYKPSADDLKRGFEEMVKVIDRDVENSREPGVSIDSKSDKRQYMLYTLKNQEVYYVSQADHLKLENHINTNRSQEAEKIAGAGGPIYGW
jgi:hypothetical protein